MRISLYQVFLMVFVYLTYLCTYLQLQKITNPLTCMVHFWMNILRPNDLQASWKALSLACRTHCIFAHLWVSFQEGAWEFLGNP